MSLWKVGSKPPHLRICQQEKFAHQLPRQFGSLDHATTIASSRSMGPNPRGGGRQTCSAPQYFFIDRLQIKPRLDAVTSRPFDVVIGRWHASFITAGVVIDCLQKGDSHKRHDNGKWQCADYHCRLDR